MEDAHRAAVNGGPCPPYNYPQVSTMAYAQAEIFQEETRDLGEYLDAFRRRRTAIIITALVIFVLGIAAALLWPPTYRSNATILIEEQEVPADLVRSTVTSYATQRIQTISQRVMTRANLFEIIDKYELYEDERQRETSEETIEHMREDISLDMLSADVIDPRSGRPMPATIAFTLSFSSEDPAKTQKVASELTSLFLSENLKSRTEKAEETYVFLSEEAQRLNTRIAELETALAEFKEQHVYSLPELKELNTQLLDRTDREISDTNTQIRTLDDRIIYLQSQLSTLEPYGDDVIMNPAARLKALRTQYIGLVTKYSPEHPDVLNLKREIRGLELETGLIDDTEEKLEQLDTLRTELAAAKKKYSENHPDIIRLNKEIAAVETSLRESPDLGSAIAKRTPDNPAYVTLQSQLDSSLAEIRALKTKKSELEDKLAEYERRLTGTPQVEREYRGLLRDYENATLKYREIHSKQMEAQVGQQLEQERKGERFTLIDPAALPEEPISPNRPAIVFLSLVFAIGGGVGFAAIGESLDKSVRGIKGVTATLGVAPLAMIPFRETAEDKGKRIRHKVLVTSTVVGGIVAVLLLAHFFWTPLDVLWFKVLRKASIVADGF